MSHNPSDAGIPPGQAVFLPAFQLPAVSSISNPRERAIFPGAKELNWFDPKNEHWSYCAGLYSLGQSSLKLDDPSETMITQRDVGRTLLIADSGGYQLGKGTFKKIEGKMSRSFLKSIEYDELRLSILYWMEKYADYGMIIDFPAWAIGEPGFVFDKFQECLEETKRNMLFFRDNLSGDSNLKLLSVIQGRSIDEAFNWYNAIKDISEFPYSGWSFAGPVVSDSTITLRMILKLLKDGRLNEKENWIHLLGRGSQNAIFVFNIFQHCLDKYINKNIRISYDISTPFLMSGRFGKVYTHIEKTKSGYTMPFSRYRELKSLVKVITGYKKRSEWCGPFDKDLFRPDLHVPITPRNKYGLDDLSSAYLTHRNVYLYCQGMRVIMHNTLSLEEPENRSAFPSLLRRFRNDVLSIFERFASGGMTDDEICYLDISREYEALI